MTQPFLRIIKIIKVFANFNRSSKHSSFLNDVGVVFVYAGWHVFELWNLEQGLLLLFVAIFSAQLLDLLDTDAVVALKG